MENDANIDDADEIEIVSRSQLKRESQGIQKLGKRLTELSVSQLEHIPLDEPVLEAIALAHKIQNKRSALKRHFQYLGKLLRARDTDEIFAALERFEKVDQIEIQRHQQAERWRDQILEQGFDAVEAFVEHQESADRQRLRLLWRNYSHAKSHEKKIQNSRLIYKEVKQVLDANAA